MWWKLCIVCRGEPCSPVRVQCTRLNAKRSKQDTYFWKTKINYIKPKVSSRRANTVRPYKIAVILWYLYSLFLSQCFCLYLRAANDRPYRFVPTTTMLRSGKICFDIAQTIFTNRERRLAIWKFTNYHNATLGQNMFWYCTNYLHELGTAARRAVAINSKI